MALLVCAAESVAENEGTWRASEVPAEIVNNYVLRASQLLRARVLVACASAMTHFCNERYIICARGGPRVCSVMLAVYSHKGLMRVRGHIMTSLW